MEMNEIIPDPYADCRNAIALVETELGQMVLNVSRRQHTTPEQFIVNMKTGFAKGAMLVRTGKAKGDAKGIMMVKAALLELDLPSFKTYIAGVLGSM